MLRRFLQRSLAMIADESGATAIEYGLMVGLISVGMLAGWSYSVGRLDALYTAMADMLAAI